MTDRHRFTRSLRLLSGREFQRVFDGAQQKVGSAHFLLLATSNGLDNPRLGLVVAKKKVKLSVNRNKVKRQVRESFRLNQHELPSVDIIFLARGGLTEMDGAALRAEIENAFRRLKRRFAGDVQRQETPPG